MLRNYFRVMFRNLMKRKMFTLINLFGLATGMAVCLLLVIYIQNEFGYDNFHQHGDQIYRLALERKYPYRASLRGHIPLSIAQAVKKEFPEVLEFTHVATVDEDGSKVEARGKTFTKESVLAADSNFFRVFTGNFLQGNARTALLNPGTVVLNETTAKKYFGSVGNAMDKQIIVDDFTKLTVSAVCKDWPQKSHMRFDLLMTISVDVNRTEYVYFGPYTYLLLNKNASASSLESKFSLIVNKYVAPVVPGLFGEPYDKFVAEGNGYRYFLQPIQKIHLNSELDDEILPTRSIRSIQIFGAVAAFILFLACVNFINLSTALSVERAKEVGIRKTFGSLKSSLVWQFLSEAVLFSFMSMLLALLLVYLFVPLLNKISGNELSFIYFLQPPQLLLVLAFSILVGVVAGLYPAFVLSSFNPISVLKGRFKSNSRGVALRNGLVIFQFAVSVILIICTIVINKQMQYVLSDRLGFKRDHIISVQKLYYLRWTAEDGKIKFADRRQAFVDEISRIPGVGIITKCDQLPGIDDQSGGGTWVALENNYSRTEKLIQIDDNYSKLLGLQMLHGRFFSKEFTTDSLGLILNESAVQDFGLKNPIGSRLISKEPFLNSTNGKEQNVFTVIGVVKDFHFQSLHKSIAPLIFINSNKFGWGQLGVSIQGYHFKTAISEIEKTWHRFDSKHDLQFSFYDQSLAAQYKSEETEQKILTTFSLLAILIACVGLFGLATFSTLQRTKEISIRKVLGAMPATIIMILSRDFLRLVLVASLIAFPVAWWAMHKWLQNFAYRVDISWWIFLVAGSIAAMIAMITISFQAIKAAIANPAKSLRAE